jgi:hypothetical protein
MDELRRLSAAHYDPLTTSVRTGRGDGMAGTGTGSGLWPRPSLEEEEKVKTEDQARGANSSQGRGRAAYMYTPADRAGSSLNSESAYVTPSARTFAQSKRETERSGTQIGGALSAPHSAADNSPGSVPVPVAYTHTTSYPTSYNTYPSQSKSRSRSPLPSTDSTLYHAPVSSSFSSLLPAPTSTSFSTLGAGKSPDMPAGNVTSLPLSYPYSSSIGHSSGGMNREVLSSWEKAWGNSDEEGDLQGHKERESYGDTGRGYFLDRIDSFDVAGDVESTGFIVNRGSRSSSPVVAAALGIIRAATGERREAKEKEEEEEGLALEGESDSSGSRAWDLARNRGHGPHSAGSGIGRGIGSGRGDRVRALLMRREAARLSDSSEEEEEGGDHDRADTAMQRRGRERGSAGHTRISATDAAESVGKGKGASYHIPTSRRDEEGQDSTPVGWQVPPHASGPFLETPNTILTRMRARLMQGDGEGEGMTSPYPPSPPSPSGALNSSNPQTGKSPESTSSSSSVSNSISSRSGSRASTGTGTGGCKTVRIDVDVRSADRGRGLGEEEKTHRVDSRNFDSRTASALGDEEVLKRALGVDSDEEEGDCTEEDSAASDERYQRARATLFNLMHSKPSAGK